MPIESLLLASQLSSQRIQQPKPQLQTESAKKESCEVELNLYRRAVTELEERSKWFTTSKIITNVEYNKIKQDIKNYKGDNFEADFSDQIMASLLIRVQYNEMKAERVTTFVHLINEVYHTYRNFEKKRPSCGVEQRLPKDPTKIAVIEGVPIAFNPQAAREFSRSITPED